MLSLLAAAWGGLTSRVAGPIATALAAGLALALTVQGFQLRAARASAAQLQASITTPVTGWSARLAACSANATGLEGQLKDQTAKVTAQAAAQAAKLAEARALAVQAEAGRKRSEALVAQLSSYQTAAGADDCADLMAADAVVLGSLK